jgi:hypothetical protein
MARVQREYWQRRNRWAGLKFWAEFVGLAIGTFIAAGAWLMVADAAGILP